MTDLHPDDFLAAFALDALTDEEREVVLTHLVGCARCRHEVSLLRSTLQALPMAISDAPAPPLDLRERILREAARTDQIRARPIPVVVAARPPERRRAWLAGWVAAAAL
ncbi:MAG TPA: zf-HC2 domain-containing protein, partial [Chloroflexota bacterium]|nr:zf-HC2 domain-containing protein [Chloroflexota bacterium]